MDLDDLLNEFEQDLDLDPKPAKSSKSKKDLPPSQPSKPAIKKPGTSNHQDSYFDIDDEVEARPYTAKPKSKKNLNQFQVTTNFSTSSNHTETQQVTQTGQRQASQV